MLFFQIIILLITVSYFILILTFTIGWFKLKYYEPSGNKPSTFVSIIIAARNEENNINDCLNDIIKQNYPVGLFEMIIVDDNSTDNTVNIINSFMLSAPEFNIKLLNLKDFGKQGKKEAINEAIKISEGELVITTDADCRLSKKWLSVMSDYYETNKPAMLLAPVAFQHNNNLFSRLQSLEFMSLIAASAGSAAVNMPVLCNGANLAYRKDVFLNAEGYLGNKSYASGDDMFLMFKAEKLFPRKIMFIKNKDAIVTTNPSDSFKSFFEQRKRWISKTKAYDNFRIIAVAAIVYLFNLLSATTLIAGIFSYDYILLFIIIFSIKLSIDYPLLSNMSNFMGKPRLMLLYIPLQFIYIFYVTFIGLLGTLSPYIWKNRVIRN